MVLLIRKYFNIALTTPPSGVCWEVGSADEPMLVPIRLCSLTGFKSELSHRCTATAAAISGRKSAKLLFVV